MLTIQGMVKAADEFDRRMQRGIAPEAKSIMAENNATERDFLVRSRRAFIYLCRLAKMPPHRLPTGNEWHRDTPKPIRISYVSSDLDGCLKALAQGSAVLERRDSILGQLQMNVLEIEELCRRDGTVPAGLPNQSGNAYAMMKWMATRANLDLYLKQVDVALPLFQHTSAQRWPGTPLPTGVRFAQHRYAWHPTTNKHEHTWNFQTGFLKAKHQHFAAVAQIGEHGLKADSAAIQCFQRFIDSIEFIDMSYELDEMLHGRLSISDAAQCGQSGTRL